MARGGWTLAVLKAPFGPELGAAARRAPARGRAGDGAAARPGTAGRSTARRSRPRPALLPEGLAPGEDEPSPPEFTAAVEAYRGGRAGRGARRPFDALEARGDGWLLPPEARLNRALCLARAGQRDAARRILLRTGDSRFEDAIDRLLEAVAGGAR